MEKVLSLSISKNNIINSILIYLLLLFIPMFLEKIIVSYFNINAQLIVGSLVNFILFISYYKCSGYKNILLVCTMPSLSTMLSGILFNFNIVSIAMIPFIWIGNFILIYLMKYLNLYKNKNIIYSSIISIISKTLIIFIGFILITRFININNSMFNTLLKSMSYMQLITGLIGFIIFSFYKKIFN